MGGRGDKSKAVARQAHLNKSDHRLEFFIKDNGIGFDLQEAIVKRSPWRGLGLLSMRERTELSGGLFGVESAKGKGTTVRASWLLSANNSEKLLSQEFKSSNV